jgi:hypothetical protein
MNVTQWKTLQKNNDELRSQLVKLHDELEFMGVKLRGNTAEACILTKRGNDIEAYKALIEDAHQRTLAELKRINVLLNLLEGQSLAYVTE